MKKSFWNKKIPTLIGLFILLVGTITTTLLINKGELLQVNALSSDQPKNVRITNITDTSFSVTYITEKNTSGSINYGKDKSLGQTALDDRNQTSGKLTNYSIHSITVKNLIPSTKYFFTITSGQKTYATENQPFEVTTGPSLPQKIELQNYIKGKIITLNGNPPNESIVYITTDKSQVISFLVDANGNYSFLLSETRTKDLSSFHDFSSNQIIKMLIVGNLGTSSVIISSFDVNSVPTVTLSKDYDFTQEDTKPASVSASLESFPSLTNTTSSNNIKDPKILTPTKDEGFSDQQPLFKGTGLPNQDVEVVIHSDEQIKANVTIDASGNWSYRPLNPLSPGTHTITITTKDASGIVRAINQSFVVYASGTQIAQAISSPTPTPLPRATLAPTPTPTPTPIPTPTPVSTTTLLLSPTPIPTPIPTPTNIASNLATPTPIGQLPPAGNPSIIFVGIMGVFISLTGGLLFLLTRKSV